MKNWLSLEPSSSSLVLGLASTAAVIAVVGVIMALAGWVEVGRFRRKREVPPAELPAMTVLKPLYGDEPLLEAALASVCAQDYPLFQVVFGVQDPTDPALAVVAGLRARFPDCDIAVVVDDSAEGPNRKVANLMNMLPAARYDVLVIADSDMHAAPDYLRRIATALAVPGTGLVTTLYSGLPGDSGIAAELGATGISHLFLPGAIIARRLGRQDCLGATMALRRETLEAVGGFAALVNHLADDQVLGRLVRNTGMSIGLAATVPATTVPETTIGALFRHELRWGRTILALSPLGFVLSAIQYPVAWALLSLVLSGFEESRLALVLAVWVGRALLARGIDVSLGLRAPAPVWLLPLRDLISMAVFLTSFVGRRVEWRGRTMRTVDARAAGRASYKLPGATAT
jgi:ceramide glucosyltransferase